MLHRLLATDVIGCHVKLEIPFAEAKRMSTLRLRISEGYTGAMPKVLVSLPETDLRVIDAAARKAGETRSSFLRRAALAEARRVRRPLDDPASRRAFSALLRRAERRTPISTAEALEARNRGRR